MVIQFVNRLWSKLVAISLEWSLGAHLMATAILRPFLRPQLDVVFVALNPPIESNGNGHYFSGRHSRFFDLLYLSGLTTENLSKSAADDTVFGSTSFNHKSCQFGVVDLVEDVVQTNSGKVRPTTQHVDFLFGRLRQFDPRFVCVIHYKVREALDRHPEFMGNLQYGICGPMLLDCKSKFVSNYFPNGNSVSDDNKIDIFRELRDAL